jgi:TonB family C-terminal domain
MFDKLIESDSNGEQSKNRGRYFSVSAFAMSAFLFSGVIVSIYGAEFEIGTGNLELAQLIAPVVPTEPQPDPPKRVPQQQQTAVRSASELPMRQAAIQNITEVPNKILPVSSVPSRSLSRPEYGNFQLGPIDTNPPAGLGNGEGNEPGSGLTSGNGNSNDPVEPSSKTPPPPVEKAETKKSNVVMSLGVVNGKARSLPTPPYPAAAKQLGISGSVSVQITIDFDGSVMSSKAVDGHQLLRRGAEEAAKRAKFSPTYLSNQPVRATGVITYNFKKS